MRLYYNSGTPPDETWVRVSAVVSFPQIATRRNSHGYCVVKLRDFDGALYSTWEPRDLTELIVTDDAGTSPTSDPACNILFRGILINKTFTGKDLTLEIAGFAIELSRKSFGADEETIGNYELAAGYVKGALQASDKIYLQYKDLNDVFQDFDWIDDYWNLSDKDVALIIRDRTSTKTIVTWLAKDPIAIEGHTSTSGDYEDTHDLITGENYYKGSEIVDASYFDMIITPTMEGDTIDSLTEFLKKITIDFRYKWVLKEGTGKFTATGTLALQIYKTGDAEPWKTISYLPLETPIIGLVKDSGWCHAVWTDPENGVNTELAKYLHKTDDDYDALEGLRFKLTGWNFGEAYGDVYIDYLRVKVEYAADDILGVMHPITDTGSDVDGDYVITPEVTDWTKMDITIDEDAFQIAQNTRQIVDDIAAESGVPINIIGRFDREFIIVPTGDEGTNDWYFPAAGTKFDDIDEDWGSHDASYIAAGSDDDGQEEIFTFTGHGITVESWEEVTSIKVYAYVSADPNTIELDADIFFDGGWVGVQSFDPNSTPWVERSYEWTGRTGNQADMDAFKLKFIADSAIGVDQSVMVDTVKVLITISEIPQFDKYMARKFKGQHCKSVLDAVCAYEGSYWIEDYVNHCITIHKDGYEHDSGVDLTEANYESDWEFEDICNQVKHVYVWGKTSYDPDNRITSNIKYHAFDLTVTGDKSVQIIDNTILTFPEAQELATTQLALLNTKRPSIRIPLDGVNEDLQLGKTVGLTMARPTVGADDYPIRMIERFRRGKTGIKTIVYCGMGETKWDEKILKMIQKAERLAHKSLSDKLSANPYDVGVGGVNWGDVGGADAGAVAAVLADDKYIRNYENDATSGDLTVANLITAGNVDGVDVSGLPASIAAKVDAAGARAAIGGIIGADGKLDAALDCDDNFISNIDYLVFSEGGNMQEGFANELATNDTNWAASQAAINTALALKLNLSGGNLTGNVTCDGGVTIDGKDVSSLVTDAEAQTYIQNNGLSMAAGQEYVFNDGDQWVIRRSGGSLIGLYHNATGSYLRVRGDTTLQLGTVADAVVVEINTGVMDVQGNITVSGNVDGVDVSAISATNLPTAINTWKVLYSDGAGALQEVALGADGTILTSTGAGAAPAFEAAAGGGTLDACFDLGKEIDGADGEANAVQIGEAADRILFWHDGATAGHIKTNANHLYLESADEVRIYCDGEAGSYKRFQESNTEDDICEFNAVATTSTEKGRFGQDESHVKRPYLTVYSHEVFNDDGTIESYQDFDDLQLLRDVQVWDKTKVVIPEFPDFKQHVWDVNTLPWVKCHPNVNALAADDNEKRYSLGMGPKVGYLLSTIKKMLEVIDNLELRIKELEEK